MGWYEDAQRDIEIKGVKRLVEDSQDKIEKLLSWLRLIERNCKDPVTVYAAKCAIAEYEENK